MKKSTFTLILFFSSVILYAQQNELMFHSLGSQHGLTYSAVRDILQDSKGYIWIATLKGLNRYDGYNIKQYYKSDDGLSSNCIEKLLLLGQDTLLMGTNEGLCLYDMMREKFTTIVPQTKAPLYVLDMAYDGRSVFIASDSGLYAYSKTEQSMPLLHKGLIVKVTLDMNGNVWAVSPNTIYCFRPNGQMTRKITATEVLRIILSSLLLFIKIRRGLYGWERPKTDCTDTTRTIINSYPWSSLHKTERICVIFAASKKICVEIYGSEPKTDFSSMTIQITATYNIGSMQKMSNPD